MLSWTENKPFLRNCLLFALIEVNSNDRETIYKNNLENLL